MAEEKQINFKTRVLNTVIKCSRDYFTHYVSVDYLIISDAFHLRPYYIISAEKSNFLHLVGVSTNLSPTDFYERCYDGTLIENDFDISTHGQDAKASKGSIRRKINALPHLSGLINESSLIEEGFRKNAISCSIASSDGSCTLGFIAVPNARPKTLLSGDELNHSKAAPIKVILVKPRKSDSFVSIKSGTLEDLVPYYDTIGSLLSDELRSQIESVILERNTYDSAIHSQTSKIDESNEFNTSGT